MLATVGAAWFCIGPVQLLRLLGTVLGTMLLTMLGTLCKKETNS